MPNGIYKTGKLLATRGTSKKALENLSKITKRLEPFAKAALEGMTAYGLYKGISKGVEKIGRAIKRKRSKK